MKPDGHRRRPTQKAKQQNQNRTLEGSLKNIQRPPCGLNLLCLEACCLRSCLVKAFSHLPIAVLPLPGVSCGHMHFLLHASFTHSPPRHTPPTTLRPPPLLQWEGVGVGAATENTTKLVSLTETQQLLLFCILFPMCPLQVMPKIKRSSPLGK